MSEMRHGRSTDDGGHRATSSHTGAARQHHQLDDLNRTTRSRTQWATQSIVMSPSLDSRLEHLGKPGSPAHSDKQLAINTKNLSADVPVAVARAMVGYYGKTVEQLRRVTL